MTRIADTFARLRAAGRPALVPFVTAGDPAPKTTVAILHGLVAGGADVIELGVPFSDPMADGPVVQRSSERALKNGVTLQHVLQYVAEFRTQDAKTPIVLMGYANPIERMGLAAFVKAASAAGVDGVLIVDYPPEESEAWIAALEGSPIDPIFLLSPTSSEARIELVSRVARGYIYYVSLKGVTGAANIDTTHVKAMIQKIRTRTQVPVGVGFGIRDGATARQVAQVADAVVIGSRVVQDLVDAGDAAPARAREVMTEFRSALDSSLPLGGGPGRGSVTA